MLGLRFFSSLALSMTVAGCSNHPLPKDVTRDTTFSIVEKIRCETRDALVEQIKIELEKEENRSRYEIAKNSTLLNAIVAGNSSPEFFCNLHPSG